VPARREELPRFIQPMLARSGPVAADDGWAVEVKFDGCRMQVRCDGCSVSLRSRPGRLCTDEFPELQELAAVLGTRQVVLDGELVCLRPEDGKPDFSALRNRLGHPGPRPAGRATTSRTHAPATYMVFDVLHVSGRAVRELPYWRRRELLAELGLHGPAWQTPRHWVGETAALLRATAEQSLEGIVAKRLDAPYAEGRRSGMWVKHKHRRRERLIVTGWRARDGELPEFLLARRGPEGALRPAGRASLGLDPDRRAALIEALAEHELPPRRRRGSVRWVAPVVEVDVDAHGAPDGPVRDAVLRDVYLSSMSR
jgi:bifunctional non-homologous end joining protein LigD